ncbi:hypothetical protein SEA_ZETA1847_54 [Microbacterium phage Zeta1847]|uniref:Uncharacterized protein n=1 Tax=Microbacterium phage Zeta1847 TaxID=2201444 RepID=A0A2Z4QAY1_9CAUD|nr:hypothetical protein HOT46_gp54 [Microbacterium phage Zeta1847]AWY06688.1 hypothetical protein SEA_ZETA1847_54 [Microbacterium phage Zeta1847]
MPHKLFGRAVRHHIADLRDFTPDRNPWNAAPDGFLLAPLAVAYQQATADVLEYLVDTYGPEDGARAFRNLLETHAELLPEPLTGIRADEPIAPQGGDGTVLRAAIMSRRDARAHAVARSAGVGLTTEPVEVIG